MRKTGLLWPPFIVGVFLLMITGCDKEGPAETAGKKFDQAMEEAKQDLRRAKESIEEQAARANESVQRAAEQAREDVLHAKENVENAMKK